jgi:hypothetical protein
MIGIAEDKTKREAKLCKKGIPGSHSCANKNYQRWLLAGIVSK